MHGQQHSVNKLRKVFNNSHTNYDKLEQKSEVNLKFCGANEGYMCRHIYFTNKKGGKERNWTMHGTEIISHSLI